MSATLALARRGFLYFWKGPSALPRALTLEWRLVAVRWLGVLFVAPALLLMPLPPGRRLAAYGVLMFAVVYNLVVQGMMRRKVALADLGSVTTVLDSLLNLAMLVSISDSFNSPFSYFLFSATVSVAMRYGYGPGAAMALIYVASDAANTVLRQQRLDSTFVIYSGFLLITALLASYLREEAHRAEQALQERLRQADLLNEATARLGASLEFQPLLQAVAAAAAHLFGGECAVLRPAAALNDADGGLPISVAFPAARSDLHAELARLCLRSADRQAEPGEPPLWYDTLPSGRRAAVLLLTLPTRQATLATLALALPAGMQRSALDADILESFSDRVALAIENASLYRTLARNSEDLQRAYGDLAIAHQELLSVDEMKTNFLANVSHELRTPLTSIRSFSELLLSYDDPAVREEFLQIINAESERLTRLVNDVLDITKIESGYMEWQMATVDLPGLLRDAARVAEPTMAERGLCFLQEIAPDLPPVYGDHDRLQQVLANLLNNAMKFTPAGTIRLGAAVVGAEARVFVADTGVGVPAEDQERIFEKFQQVGATLTDKPQGTGLGLAICRDIIAHHKGRLWVQSRPGEGSTFTFALPATAAAAAGADAAPAAA